MKDVVVSCVMLVHDGREAMAAQAIGAFAAQTIPRENRELVILDTSEKISNAFAQISDNTIRYIYHGPVPYKVGFIRNFVNRLSVGQIIAHWDSDDWSHPARLMEQVESLLVSDAQCIGYNRVPFWKAPHRAGEVYTNRECTEPPGGLGGYDFPGEAWLYTGPDNRPVGSSLMYWRAVWQQNMFRDDLPTPGSTGEDVDFVRRIDARSCLMSKALVSRDVWEPRLIARIHGANTTTTYTDGTLEKSDSWRRAPELDEYCRQMLEGK